MSACVAAKVNDLCRRFEGFIKWLNEGYLFLLKPVLLPNQAPSQSCLILQLLQSLHR